MVLAYLVAASWAHMAVSNVDVPDPIKADVVVVGAGQAGMAAAAQLSKQGHSVHVLEATDHVGGRTRNVDIATQSYDVATDEAFEMGGTWLSTQHTAALELCQAFGIEVFNASFLEPHDPPDAAEDADYPWWYWGADYPADQRARVKQLVIHTQSGTHQYQKPSELLSAFNASCLGDLERAGAYIDNATSSIDDRCWQVDSVGDSWMELDQDSTGGRLRPYLSTKEARQILRNTIHNHNAQEPEAVGFLYNVMSFKGCNSAQADDTYRVRGGTQAIPLAILASLGHNRVSLSSPVRSIESADGVVRAVTHDGRVVEAKAAVVTGPPPTVLGIEFSPPLKGADAQLLQRMPMGSSMKFAAVYDGGPWWRSLGLQGDILSTALPEQLSMPGGVPEARLPLFVQCVDHSPFSRNFGVIACFMEGRQNLYFATLPHEQQEDLFLRFLERSLNSSRVREPRPSFVRHNWMDQPYARGAYTNYMAPGVQSVPEYWAAYRSQEKLPGVFLAGADYHTGFGNGYIEGAIRSGQGAADTIHKRFQERVTEVLL
eukprot:TRINITY_DN39487_c0_g1_i1.p1 TRINITY_DN39487_c0_g1~~TRINITY_DN39487_c0_g1_i1.p1  ORF type:complete len:544 (-),score=66.42 TRINITY_DN39487_c0_g1_i1:16-1647(-)